MVDNFRNFLRCNVLPYQRPELPVHFVGSMASQYHEQLEQAVRQENFVMGRVMKSPLDGLVAYHGKN